MGGSDGAKSEHLPDLFPNFLIYVSHIEKEVGGVSRPPPGRRRQFRSAISGSIGAFFPAAGGFRGGGLTPDIRFLFGTMRTSELLSASGSSEATYTAKSRKKLKPRRWAREIGGWRLISSR
jgi:hypothetical protein